MTKNLSLISADQQYIAERERRRQRFEAGAGGAGAGVLAGGTEMARGIVEGVGGIFTKPIEGAQEEGALGFFKGVGQGILGAAVKPVVGVTDGVMTALQGVSNELANVKAHEPVSRLRVRTPLPHTDARLLVPYAPVSEAEEREEAEAAARASETICDALF